MIMQKQASYKKRICEERKRSEHSRALREALRKYNLKPDNLEDISVSEIRRIQIQPIFKDFRSFKMNAPLIRDALKESITGELLVTRVGSVTRAAGHYIPRPEGSLDHVFQYCLEGEGWCEMEGNSWRVPPDHAILIPAGVPHYYGAVEENPWTHYWIHFTGTQAAYYTKLLGVTPQNPVFKLPRSPHIISGLESIYHLATMPQVTKHLVATTGALANFLGMINLERFSQNPVVENAEKRIAQTIEYMQQNLGQPLTLSDLARIACMSPPHYSSLFKQRESCPPIQFLIRLRIQKACKMLLSTNMKIQQVANELGFKDPFYFSRVFHSLVGKSPSVYRRESQTGTKK